MAHQLGAVSTALARDQSAAYPHSLPNGVQTPESISPSLLHAALRTLDHDDATSLARAINDAGDSEPWKPISLYVSMLKGSDTCFEHMIAQYDQTSWTGVQVYWILVKIGRQASEFGDWRNMPGNRNSNLLPVVNVEKAISMLCRMINYGGPPLQKELWQEDSLGNLALHRAIKYGLFRVCECLLYLMGDKSCAALQQNKAGHSPLTIAVLENIVPITKVLLHELRSWKSMANSASDHIDSTLDDLLTLAVCF